MTRIQIDNHTFDINDPNNLEDEDLIVDIIILQSDNERRFIYEES